MKNKFQKEIMEDINWRYSELSILRTLPFRYGLNTKHKSFLIRYSVPIIYSLWEGYIKFAFETYVREINLMKLDAAQLHPKLLAHAINSVDKLNLQNQRQTFKAKVEFTESLMMFLSDKIEISSIIPTESNINFEVLSKLLNKFNLEEISNVKYKAPLNKFLIFRNSVSHGDNSIPVTGDDIGKFCTLINDLMTEVYEKLENGIESNTFMKQDPIENLLH